MTGRETVSTPAAQAVILLSREGQVVKPKAHTLDTLPGYNGRIVVHTNVVVATVQLFPPCTYCYRVHKTMMSTF